MGYGGIFGDHTSGALALGFGTAQSSTRSASTSRSSYRFNTPLMTVAAAALAMIAILGFGVLVITYVPWLTTGLLHLTGRY